MKKIGEDVCPLRKKCGGCVYQGLSYREQLDKKQRPTEKLMGKFGPVHPIVGMEDPYHYRNKVHGVFDRDRKGNIISGIYKEGTHHVIPVESCLIEDETADRIIGTIRLLARSFKMKIYDEDTGWGWLRHVLIRRGFATGQIMVVLVTATPMFPSKTHFVKALRKEYPQITTIVQNINDRKTSMVLGDREQVIYGKGYIEDVLCQKTFRISARSFYQVNPVQTEKLYGKAVEQAGLTGSETVIDAYCGIGTIGMTAADRAESVIGVELNRDAVRDAISNARRNKVENIRFVCDDAGQFMVKMAAAGKKADVVFMDPPRSGSDKPFLESLVRMGPERVVYISCDPETLARDAAWLRGRNYQVEGTWPYDMFPWTEHTECVCLLSKRKPDSH